MADVPVKHLVSQDFLLSRLMNAILHPLASDPGSPTNYQIWSNSTTGRMMMHLPGGSEQIAFMSDVTGGSITGALWDANTIIKADTDDTPIPMTIAPSTIVGRTAAGSIAALTAAEVSTILALPTGTVANQAYVDAAIAALADTAPAQLDTLNELAAALGDDANFAASMTTALGDRLQSFGGLIGDAAATTIAVTHGFTREVQASLYLESSGEKYYTGGGMGASGSTTYSFEFAVAPALNEYRVVISGKP